MEVELVEIRDFLATQPSFQLLSDEQLNVLPKKLIVRYVKRGKSLVPSKNNNLTIVRTGAVEVRDHSGTLIDKYAEGDVFVECGWDDSLQQALNAVAIEDSLLYLLPCEFFETLRQQNTPFDQYFTDSVSARLQHAVKVMTSGSSYDTRLMKLKVTDLLKRPAVRININASIREAAQLMTVQHISSLLVMDQDRLVGILTDRDIRTRCVAAGLDAGETVRQIMTHDLHSVSTDDTALQAFMMMASLNVHHLPVVDHEQIHGVLTDTDILKFQSLNMMNLVNVVFKSDSFDALVEASRQLGELQIQMVNTGASWSHIGRVISSVVDAMTQRLIQLAELQFGEPPVAYAWLALGSQARHEQCVHTDQDNALILSDDYVDADHAVYFKNLADYVTDGLNACGIEYCPGDIMARNTQWHQPLQTWLGYFNRWIESPEKRSLMLANNFFDMRVVHGDQQLVDTLRRTILDRSKNNTIFLAHMMANALQQKPPLGFFRNFLLVHGGEHNNTLDLKHHGLMPIVDMVRVLSLSAGLPEISTRSRLVSLARNKIISQDSVDELKEAFKLIGLLRARHQVKQLQQGLAADNFVLPEELNLTEKKHLKDAFSVIKLMQENLAQQYQTDRIV